MIFRRIVSALGVVVALAGAYVCYRMFEARYWMVHSRDVRPGQSTFAIEPREVEPGESFTLVADFERAYDFGFATANDEVHVFDAAGADHFITPDERLGLGSLPSVGFTFPGKEGIGCPVSVGPPTEPPRTYADRQQIVVLPETPAGRYVLRLEPGAYCNALPSEPVDLLFRVVAPTSI